MAGEPRWTLPSHEDRLGRAVFLRDLGMKLLPVLYAAVTFLSALLLFLLELIGARQLLPLFGGSAAVWTTCLVFFQCALLTGYLYARLVATRLQPRAQPVIHLVLLTAALLSLAVRVPNPYVAGLVTQ